MKNRRRSRSDTAGDLKLEETFKCTSYNLCKTSIQVLLKFQLIEKRNSRVHLIKFFAVWCRAKEEIKDGYFFFFFMLN